MCPCDPNSLNVAIPDVGSVNIPGFGSMSTPKTPSLGLNIPTPPDLTELFKLFSFLLPVGELKSPLNPNFGKDILDQIIKLLDQFMPFLMFYKFFLPILKLFLCILEIICALPNPVKVAIAIQKLFRECIPLFLALFPIIALIIMIIAILILIIQIIIYLILLIVNFIKLIIKNILILYDAIAIRNEKSILAAVQKIGRVICLFQNLFTILLMIDLIIKIFKDLLSMAFAIPPCGDPDDDGGGSSCCTPDVCPKFIKNGDFIRTTGTIHYNSSLKNNSGESLRGESLQFFDDGSLSTPGTYVKEGIQAGSTPWYYQQFINIIAPNDPNYKEQPSVIKHIEEYGVGPEYFPSDASYNAESPPGQVPYLVDMEFTYDPSKFGRSGDVRKVQFKNCIVTRKTSKVLTLASNQKTEKAAGVIFLSGGKGYEEDGTTVLNGYIGTSPSSEQATLETFLFTKAPNSDIITNVDWIDSFEIMDVKYTFKINHSILVSKNIITYSCMPDISQDKGFANAVFSSDLNLKIAQMKDFPFPDPAGAQQCIISHLDTFRNNVTQESAQALQENMIACLTQLQQDTENAINIAIPLAFDKFKSTITLTPSTQFTTDKIKVQLDLKESSGSSLIKLLPPGSAEYIISKISPKLSLGSISSFTYDGDKYFQAEITSQQAGDGTIEIAFENKKISDILPENTTADLTQPLTLAIRQVPYKFIYAQSNSQIAIGVGDQSDGTSPRRDEGDVAREQS